MNKIKKWLYGFAAGIAALFGAHKIQPTTIEQGIPPQVVVQPLPAPSPEPSEIGIPKINLGSISANDDEVDMIKLGTKYANIVNESECFHQYVLDSNFTENQGLTPGQIWNKLSSNAVTVNVVMFYGTFKQNYIYKTIGYENEPGTVYMNRFYVDSAYMVADNLMHEGEGHSQGFTHYLNKSTSEPYGMNYAFEKCAPLVGVK